MKSCNLKLIYAGYCEASAAHAVRGEKRRAIAFKALVGLIEHPVHGWILFDTGYTRRFFEATRDFPNSLYAKATKVHVTEADELASQLQRLGISPASIRHVIVSHFHADHIGGLKDFPNANYYCSRKAWQQVQEIPGSLSFTRGILKALIPEDFLQRTRFIEDMSAVETHEIWGEVYDLFRDRSIQVFPLPGHAAGQVGIMLNTGFRTCLLVADACWDRRAYQQLAMPHPVVRLFFHSWKSYRESILKLHRYHAMFPDHVIIPTHCSATTDPLVLHDSICHAF